MMGITLKDFYATLIALCLMIFVACTMTPIGFVMLQWLAVGLSGICFVIACGDIL
jgi:hypothetical protein